MLGVLSCFGHAGHFVRTPHVDLTYRSVPCLIAICLDCSHTPYFELDALNDLVDIINLQIVRNGHRFGLEIGLF